MCVGSTVDSVGGWWGEEQRDTALGTGRAIAVAAVVFSGQNIGEIECVL